MSIWWPLKDDLQAEAVAVAGGGDGDPHDGGRLGLALLPRLLHMQVSGNKFFKYPQVNIFKQLIIDVCHVLHLLLL